MSAHENDPERSTIRLRALMGEPLRDDGVRQMVIATARAIAERTGVTLYDAHADDRSVTVTIAGNRIAAMGLASELRRLTMTWYARKYDGAMLWGAPPQGDGNDEMNDDYFHDDGEEWKRN